MQKLYRKEDIVGKIFGYLIVQEFFPSKQIDSKRIDACALVKCTYNNCKSDPKKVWYRHLLSGGTISCGCFSAKQFRTHGLGDHPYYDACMAAIIRCGSNYRYKNNYYNRGIRCFWTVDTIPEFITYLESLPPRQKGESLDRIINSKNYEPGNLRWASKQIQNLNRRTVHSLQILNDELKLKIATIKEKETENLYLELILI